MNPSQFNCFKTIRSSDCHTKEKHSGEIKLLDITFMTTTSRKEQNGREADAASERLTPR